MIGYVLSEFAPDHCTADTRAFLSIGRNYTEVRIPMLDLVMAKSEADVVRLTSSRVRVAMWSLSLPLLTGPALPGWKHGVAAGSGP